MIAVAASSPGQLAGKTLEHEEDRHQEDRHQEDSGTRDQILHLIVTVGPVTAAELATQLDLTPAAIRRHLGALRSAGQIAEHRGPAGRRGRGRPAVRFVATDRGHESMSSSSADLAVDALRYLAAVVGPEAVRAFAAQRLRAQVVRYSQAVDDAGTDVAARADALATVLEADGFAATARPVPGTNAVQLCQGHCPVQHVATEFPELCEAETKVFSELLGVHVQRLVTLAGGGHVCTTNIPTTATTPSPADDLTPRPHERTTEGSR